MPQGRVRVPATNRISNDSFVELKQRLSNPETPFISYPLVLTANKIWYVFCLQINQERYIIAVI